MKIAEIDRRLVRSKLASPAPFPGAGLLALRLIVGVTFLAHGIDKLADLSGTERFFASLDIPAPGMAAPLVAVTEVVGGTLLIAGLATPLAAAALAIDMLVALATAHLGQGFFVADGGFELVLLLAGACVTIVLAGAGRLSVDAALGSSRRPSLLRRAIAVDGSAAIDAKGTPR